MSENKLISSSAIIAKLIAELDLKEDEIKITDIRQWIGDAMEKIGTIQQLEQKVVNIPVIGYQAKLPCDLYKLGQVAFSFSDGNGWVPMQKTTSNFGVCNVNECKPEMLIKDDVLFPLVKNMFNLTNDADALKILNQDQNIRQTLSALVNQGTVATVNGRFIGSSTNSSQFLSYMVKPGYIVTNTPTGYIKVQYYAIVTDEEGMPMIPDSQSYLEAIFWYITMKLMYPKKLKGLMNTRDYYDIQNSWNFYRKQAYAEAMMPSGVDELETIKNQWLTLMPENNAHSSFFSTLGDQQHIYNQNY